MDTAFEGVPIGPLTVSNGARRGHAFVLSDGFDLAVSRLAGIGAEAFMGRRYPDHGR